jgi:vesicle coat complex subunit
MALNECSEWGRIALLSTLARYKAQDVEESEHICERVLPQFQHVNAAVVLGAVKVIMIHMKNVHREELLKQLTRKMAPPLGQLLLSVSKPKLTISDTYLIRTRSSMGRSAKYQPTTSKTPRYPRQRNESLFL